MKKTVNIKFVDFWGDFDHYNNDFFNLLSEDYDVVMSDNPDLVIHSVFGSDVVNYPCVRVFFTGESVVPNFNLSDYGISFSFLSFEDRHLRMPLFALLNYKESLDKAVHLSNTPFSEKSLFCNFVYSNGGADGRRRDFFNLLTRYKEIDSAGSFLNNTGSRVEDKLSFISDYKFTIAFENSSANGYTTEKLIEAKSMGTIPIYWGDPKVGDFFNSKSFINCHDYDSFEDVIEHIKLVDNDVHLQALYHNEPFTEKSSSDYQHELKTFLTNVVENKDIRRGTGQTVEDIENTVKASNNNIVKYLIRKIKKHNLY